MQKNRLKIFISGQKYFAENVLAEIIKEGHEVVGVCCPAGDKYIGKLAVLHDIPIIPAGHLTADNFPEGVDVGLCAHSFDYVGKRVRYKPKLGWLSFHPSLLPRHRGRSSIEWAIKMGDPITGGTVFWLNAGIDRGDIERQEWFFIHPKYQSMSCKKAARRIWQEELQPMGLRLIVGALNDISEGTINRERQNPAYSTFEPSMEVKDIYKPDALMLPAKSGEQKAETKN